MNSKKCFLLSATAALALSSLATEACADGYISEPELWKGAYLGVSLGAGSGKTKGYRNEADQNNLVRIIYSGDINNQFAISQAQLFAGYNFHQPNSQWIYGGQLEGAFYQQLTSSSDNARSYQRFDDNILTQIGLSHATNTLTVNGIMSLIGRAGYLAKTNTLLYGLVGPSNVKFSIERTNKWKLGMTAGAGIEHKINEHWSFSAEYRYLYVNVSGGTNYFDFSQNIGGQVVPHLYDLSVNHELRNNMANFAVTYRV